MLLLLMLLLLLLLLMLLMLLLLLLLLPTATFSFCRIQRQGRDASFQICSVPGRGRKLLHPSHIYLP